ncbi:unnamed protein product, partial [Closterium sp. NIES-64]
IEATALGAGEAAALGASASAAPGASASAAPGAGESALSSTTSAQALHTFSLDSSVSRSFFRDRTTLTPLSRPVAVSLADPSGGPVLASFSTVLPCPAALSGTLSRLYLPLFSTNLVSGVDLQDRGVDQFIPASQRVTNCTCARTSRHLATFTRRPGSSMYTHTTESPPAAESGQVAATSQVFAAASKSGPYLSLPIPQSLPPLPPGPAPTCVPCVEGRQRAAPHSSEFPLTEAPLQTLYMDMWGPARVRGQGHERYNRLVVDDYSRYTTVFPLCSKGDVTEFHHPTSRRVLSSQDVTFDESVPYYRLFPYRTTPLPPPPLFLAPSPPPVDPLPTQGPAPSELLSLQVPGPAVLSLGVLSLGVLSLGVLSLGVLSLEVLSLGVRSLGVRSLGVRSLGALGLLVWPPAVLRRGGSHSLHRSCASGLPGAGDVLLELEVLLLLLVPEVLVLEVLELLGLEVLLGLLELVLLELVVVLELPVLLALVLLELLELELLELELLGVLVLVFLLALVRLRVLELALLELEVLLALVLRLGVLSQSQLQPASPLPAPSPYTRPTGGLAERREPASRPASPVRAARTSGRTARPRPPTVRGTHQMALRPSTAPLRVPLPSPPESSLPTLAVPESDSLRAASPSVTRLLATVVTDPFFESTAASALVAELLDFPARYRLDYAASLVAKSESICPPSVGGECALSTDVLEERQEEFQCFAAALPHLVSTLIAPEGDPDAPDIPTP